MGDLYIFTTDGQTQQWWKDFLPLISPAVVILLFIIDRIVAARLRRKEVERNWYLKVLIEPAIEKISEFYNSTTEQHSSSFLLLQAAIETTLHTAYVDLIA